MIEIDDVDSMYKARDACKIWLEYGIVIKLELPPTSHLASSLLHKCYVSSPSRKLNDELASFTAFGT
eukprot:scaffold22942_cov228-Skeletonema_dohrnii-CCMP3373.AAC.1